MNGYFKTTTVSTGNPQSEPEHHAFSPEFPWITESALGRVVYMPTCYLAYLMDQVYLSAGLPQSDSDERVCVTRTISPMYSLFSDLYTSNRSTTRLKWRNLLPWNHTLGTSVRDEPRNHHDRKRNFSWLNQLISKHVLFWDKHVKHAYIFLCIDRRSYITTNRKITSMKHN